MTKEPDVDEFDCVVSKITIGCSWYKGEVRETILYFYYNFIKIFKRERKK